MGEDEELAALRALDAAMIGYGKELLALPGIEEVDAIYRALAELAMARVTHDKVPYRGPDRIAAMAAAICNYAVDIAEAKATIADLTRQRDLLAGAAVGFRPPFDVVR